MKLVKGLVLGIVLAVAGCAQGIRVVGEAPSAFPQAARLHNIAVYTFSGRDGRKFTDALSADLQNAQLDGRPQFTVKAGPSAVGFGPVVSSAGPAVAFGRQVGAQAVYFGSVMSSRVVTIMQEQMRRRCLQSQGLFKCLEWQTYSVPCYQWTTQYNVAPRAIDIANGSLVYSKIVHASKSYSYCADQAPQTTPQQLLSSARASAAEQVRRDVGPYRQIYYVDLKDQAPTLPQADQRRFSGAVAFAKDGRMGRACGIWQALALEDGTNSVDLLYDLAVCAEVSAEYQHEVALLTKADAMLISPDPQISSALERARRLLRNGLVIKADRIAHQHE